MSSDSSRNEFPAINGDLESGFDVEIKVLKYLIYGSGCLGEAINTLVSFFVFRAVAVRRRSDSVT